MQRTRPAILFIGTAIVVTLIGLLAALVTWRFHPQPQPPCVVNCPPPTVPIKQSAVTPLPEERTYHSSAYGFEVDYPSSWSVHASDSTGIDFGTDAGVLLVAGTKSGEQPAQLLVDARDALNPNVLQGIEPSRAIRGARIGPVSGVGQVYSATFVPQPGSGQALAVLIPVEAAVQGALAVVARGVLPFDRKTKGAMDGGEELDYALTEFRWPG